MDKLKMHTPDLADDNFRKLSAMFPNAVTEVIVGYDENGKAIIERAIDADVLRQEISAQVVEGRQERYQFNWPDKKKSIVLANSPTTETLRLDRAKSVGRDGSSGSIDTENIYIEGDNLLALKLLRETYLGKVKMIYIDPPYNTGKDSFVYDDDYHMALDEFAESSNVYDENGNMQYDIKQNNESNGRFHTDWLNMIYPRLRLAKDLLTDDGAIFISIDDNEQENLKKVCDEIFGANNFVGEIAVVNNLKGRNDKKDIATCHEYLIIYSKKNFIAGGMPLNDEQRKKFDMVDENGNLYQLRDLRKRGRPDRREDRPNMYFPIYYNEKTKKCSLEKQADCIEIFPLRGDGSDGRWRWGFERVKTNLAILEPHFSNKANGWGIQHRVYLNPALNPVIVSDNDEDDCEERSSKSKSFWLGGELSTDVGRRQLKNLFGVAFFDYSKSVKLVLNTLYMGTKPGDIILDFFSGSATTAQAVMQLNAEDNGCRKFIMIQIPDKVKETEEAYKLGYKNICEIGEERIRRAGQKIKEGIGADIDYGFRVFRVDSGNMKDVYYRPSEYKQEQLELFADNIKPDRTPEDLLFQVMLDLGIALSSRIEEIEIAEKKVFAVDDNYLLACFDSNISEETVTDIAKQQPRYAVFRDSSMASDSVAINFEQIFKTYSPKTERRVL